MCKCAAALCIAVCLVGLVATSPLPSQRSSVRLPPCSTTRMGFSPVALPAKKREIASTWRGGTAKESMPSSAGLQTRGSSARVRPPCHRFAAQPRWLQNALLVRGNARLIAMSGAAGDGVGEVEIKKFLEGLRYVSIRVCLCMRVCMCEEHA